MNDRIVGVISRKSMWKQEIASHQITAFLINSLPTCHEAATLVISTMGLQVGQALFGVD